MLKKLAAISLLFLLAFNWVGYRFVMSLLQHNANVQLEDKIDVQDYDEAALIEVRVPLHVPYITDQPEFERHYGEVEVDGKYYQYVKRKIENGELVLKCIPNETKEQIAAKANDYFKNTNGIGADPQGKKQTGNNTIKTVFGDYDDRVQPVVINTLAADCLIHIAQLLTPILPEIYIKAPAHPPDCIS